MAFRRLRVGGPETLEHGVVPGVECLQVGALDVRCGRNNRVGQTHAVRVINLVMDGKESFSPEATALLAETFTIFLTDILGLLPEEDHEANDSLVNELMEAILTLRREARERKDFSMSDRIRDELARISIRIKDTRDGAVWEKF